MMSSPRDAVPCVLEPPTVNTHGALPGALMPPNDMRPDELQALLTYLQSLR